MVRVNTYNKNCISQSVRKAYYCLIKKPKKQLWVNNHKIITVTLKDAGFRCSRRHYVVPCRLLYHINKIITFYGKALYTS